MTHQLLNSPDERVRLAAVRALAQENSPVCLMSLVSALGDASWRVRQEAVAELIRRDGNEVITPVLHVLRARHLDLSVLNSAIQVLTHSRQDVASRLTEFLADPDPQLRTSAALTLGSLRDVRAVPVLLRALDDPDANVRFHAIEALGSLRASAAVEALAEVAESRDFSLSFPALDALTAIGDARVAYRLVPLLQDKLLQTAALQTLGRLGDEAALAPIMELLNAGVVAATAAAEALASLHQRLEARYHNGALVAALVRQEMTAVGLQNLLAAARTSNDGDLPKLMLVLGWLESQEADALLLQTLSRSSVRSEAVEAVVEKVARATVGLLALLDVADLDTRRAAVLVLGRIGDARAVPSLVAALTTDDELAVEVAGALAMIGDSRAYTPLLGLIGHGNSGVRRAVVSALNSLGHPEMGRNVATLLRDPRPLVREAAVRIAAYVGYEDCVALILACCRDEQENVRRAAIESLACLENISLLPLLDHALQDESRNVRAAAARTLEQLDEEGVAPLLLGALNDSAFWVRYYAARSVRRQTDHDVRATLIRLVQTDEVMQVRVAAVEALGRLGAGSAVPLLIPLMEAPDEDLARAALAVVAASDVPSALAALLAALPGLERKRRLEALRALGKSSLAEAVGYLRQQAEGWEEDLATAAVKALSLSSAPEAVDALVALTALPARRDACVSALARAGDGQSARLARGLSHEQPDVRRVVVEALAGRQDDGALQALTEALNDPSGAVRFAALTALAHRRDFSGTSRLAALAEVDPDRAVRRAAQSFPRR